MAGELTEEEMKIGQVSTDWDFLGTIGIFPDFCYWVLECVNSIHGQKMATMFKMTRLNLPVVFQLLVIRDDGLFKLKSRNLVSESVVCLTIVT